MDMKRILQAMDSASTTPVVGADSMSKFLSIIDKNNVAVLKEEQNNNQVLSEGTNPHKVALPVQMAMQHYQQPEKILERKSSIIYKYFEQVEEEQLQEQATKQQLLNQYASQIAERVLGKRK